jgi:serine/threonine-protein kinase
VAVAALVVALTATYTVQLARERDRAQVEANTAEQVSSFLQNLFEVSDPERSRTDTITARELLDRGSQRIRTALAGQPEVQANMMHVISGVYTGLGMYREARDMSAEALAIRRRLHGEISEEVAQSETALGDALSQLGDSGAESHLRAALAIERSLHHGDDERVIRALSELGQYLQQRGSKLDEAESLYREALAMRARLGPNPGSLAELSDGLASVLNDKGDYAAAVPLYRRAVSIVRSQVPVDSVVLSTAIHNESLALTNLGRYSEAIAQEREALAITLAYYGPDNPKTSRIRSGLGVALRGAGDQAGAEEQFRKMLAVDKTRLSPNSPDLASDYGLLGNTLVAEGKPQEAEPMLREALKIRRVALGPDHPYVAISVNELAGAYLAEGKLALAEQYYRQALALRRRELPPHDPYIAYSLVGLARTFMAEHRPRAALPLLMEADTIRRQALPAGHPLRKEVDSLLAAVAQTDSGS